MKKTLFFALTVLCTCMCSVYGDPTEASALPGDFYACFADETEKTTMDSNFDLSWTAGDGISVFCNATDNQKYTFTGNTGDYNGIFTQAGSGSATASFSKYYAIYPYDESISCVSEGVFNISYPATQAYTYPRMVSGIAPMAAVTDAIGDNTLEFKNLCGFLKVSLYGKGTVKSIVLKGNNGEKLSGAATVSLSADGAPVITMADDASGEVTMEMGEGAELVNSSDKPKSFIFVLPPTEFTKGISITVNDVDKRTFEVSSTKALSVARTHLKPMADLSYAPKIDQINGTKIMDGMTLVGLISEKGSGKGIAGVPVSDGYEYCVTDENGVYQMVANPLCRYVYYSLPSEYNTALDSDHYPAFFTKGYIDPNVINRNDFELELKTVDETNWTLLGISDPQPDEQADITRYINESIPDMQNTLNTAQAAGGYPNAYAITMGDIASNRVDLYPGVKSAMCNVQLASGRYLPFYQCSGNHDHNGGKTQYESVNDYVANFGPIDYSFNIGKAHIIVVDDIIYSNWTAPEGGDYSCGLTNAQYEWLQQDLSYVKDKQDKIVFFVCHAPFADAPGDRDHVHRNNHYHDILTLLTGFHDAHILAGHTHRWRNYVHTSYVCQSGRPIYEHNQNAVGGWCWMYSNLCPDGSPQGYCVYDIRGNEVYDWVAKTTGKDASYQMRVYNGNQIFADANSKQYCWYDSSITPNYANSNLRNSLVVSLWDGDDINWKLELYVNGEKVGDLTKIYTVDMCAQSYFNARFIDYARDAQHFWYIKTPGNVDPSTLTGWEVRATQTVPSSANVKHVYTCSELQTDYTGF